MTKKEQWPINRRSQKNCGNTLATRTGSAGFSHSLAIAWVRAGFQSRNNYLYHKKTGQRMVIKEGIDLFNLIGKRYVELEDRG